MSIEFHDEDLTKLAGMFHLIGDPTRLRILLICLERPISVGEIAARLDLSASLVSHHLRLLRAARLLRGDRRGQQVIYAPADEHVRIVVANMVSHVGEMTADHRAA